MNTLQNLIDKRKADIQESDNKRNEEQAISAAKEVDMIIKGFSKNYPELVELPEFSWMPGTMTCGEYGGKILDLTFRLGKIVFIPSEQVARICIPCPVCGVFTPKGRWVRDEEILDSYIKYQDDMPVEVCTICKKELAAKKAEVESVRQKTTSEEIIEHLEAVLNLLSVLRQE
jgi:hypothetical protein